jgi:hypothetical protein
MEAHYHTFTVPCRCGGQAKIFGPSGYAPSSHWGVYCSQNGCDKMAIGNSMEDAIELWNEEQVLVEYSL